MTNRARLASHIMAAIFSFAIIAPIFYLIIDRRPVVKILAEEILPNPLITGQAAHISWTAKVLRDGCDGTIARQIIDGAGKMHDYAAIPTVFKYETGVIQEYTRTIIIPMSATPGKGKHVVHVVRWCNELQRVFWPMREAPRFTEIEIE